MLVDSSVLFSEESVPFLCELGTCFCEMDRRIHISRVRLPDPSAGPASNLLRDAFSAFGWACEQLVTRCLFQLLAGPASNLLRDALSAFVLYTICPRADA